ncbi:cytochrome c [bacterium]|nr:cytochrome c [bacterium]
MRMLFLVLLALAIGLVPVLAVAADAEAEEKPAELTGKTIFVESKCAMCHTVFAEGIGEAPEEGAEAEESDAPPDLSTVGASRTLDWLHLFLVEKEKIDGVKHMMGFKGTEEEWAVLSSWLLGLGAPADTTEAAAETGTQTSE